MVNRIRIKICGLTTADAVEAAIAAGADAVGLVLSPSPRQVDKAQAKKLIDLLPPWVASVVVTRQPPQDFVADVLSQLLPAWWQSDRDDLLQQQLPGGTRPLAVIREGEDTTTLPPWFVYEGAQSGHGTPVDWHAAAALARRGRLILAGGLDPDNIGQAIRVVRPYGVDVSSGVESEHGVKDNGRIHAFINAVRQAELELEQRR